MVLHYSFCDKVGFQMDVIAWWHFGAAPIHVWGIPPKHDIIYHFACVLEFQGFPFLFCSLIICCSWFAHGMICTCHEPKGGCSSNIQVGISMYSLFHWQDWVFHLGVTFWGSFCPNVLKLHRSSSGWEYFLVIRFSMNRTVFYAVQFVCLSSAAI